MDERNNASSGYFAFSSTSCGELTDDQVDITVIVLAPICGVSLLVIVALQTCRCRCLRSFRLALLTMFIVFMLTDIHIGIIAMSADQMQDDTSKALLAVHTCMVLVVLTVLRAIQTAQQAAAETPQFKAEPDITKQPCFRVFVQLGFTVAAFLMLYVIIQNGSSAACIIGIAFEFLLGCFGVMLASRVNKFGWSAITKMYAMMHCKKKKYQDVCDAIT